MTRPRFDNIKTRTCHSASISLSRIGCLFMKVFFGLRLRLRRPARRQVHALALNKYHFGVLICYEDSDPFMARRYLENSNDGPPVDFLVNISNDGWFDGSCEHEEHLAVSRFRAIECRRAMVRAVNMGVSAVIDSNGRVLKPTPFPNTSPPVWLVQLGTGPHSRLRGVRLAQVQADGRHLEGDGADRRSL